MIFSAFPAGGNVNLPLSFLTYTGTYVVEDDGIKSGVWRLRLTTSGVLTLSEKVSEATIQAQGGGGGGGSGGGTGTDVVSGSDGADGSIQTYTGALSSGEYSINLGAAGARGSDGAGGNGGDTTFGNLLTASGGAGGAHKGGTTLEHSGLYNIYGHGGAGGAATQYTGKYTPAEWVAWGPTNGNGMRIFTAPDINASVNQTVRDGNGVTILGSNSSAPDTVTGTGGKFYVTKSNRYILTTEAASITFTAAKDTRKWTGNVGYPGIVILSGKAE